LREYAEFSWHVWLKSWDSCRIAIALAALAFPPSVLACRLDARISKLLSVATLEKRTLVLAFIAAIPKTRKSIRHRIGPDP
jgi:hypothetical protein